MPMSSKQVKSTIWLDNGISPCFLAFEYDPHILLIFGDKILLVVQYGEEKITTYVHRISIMH